MFNLWFEDRFGDRVRICKYENEQDAVSLIYKDLSARIPNFKSYYIRSWKNDRGETIYDFGSHSEFYVSIPLN